MGLFRDERIRKEKVWHYDSWDGSHRWDGETRDYREKYLNRRGKLAIGVTALALAIGTFAEKGLDALGDKGREIPKREMEMTALAKYKDTYKLGSPAGKFVMQYLTPTRVGVHTREDDGWGLLDLTSHGDEGVKEIVINNGCLSKTAYDIAGGSVKGELNGLFSSGSVEGKIPTAAAFAEVNPRDSDELTVRSGHDNSVDLHFKGLVSDEFLVPADEQTRNIVDATNECQVGIIGTNEDGFYNDESLYLE